MTQWIPAAAIATFVLGVQVTYAQVPPSDGRSTRNAFPAGSIEGRVLDEAQVPISGAMVSVIGRTIAAASTDRDGHYTLRELPFGPYILSVHSRGYFTSRGRTVQLTTTRISVPEIQLARARAPRTAVPGPVAAVSTTQLAGFSSDMAPASTATGPDEDGADERGADETAWRLRHLPRSILKEASADTVWADSEEIEPARWRRVTSGALVPLAFFSDLALSGQVNLMTIESFRSPGQIFAGGAPRSVAFVSVNTQAVGGAWSMQGAMTQGDLASWIVAGSYKSIDSANHAYELGLSYSTQRYDGGNAAALGAIRDSGRNVGSVSGYDEWTVSPRLVLGYGTAYARYDYLDGPGVWSPRLSVLVPLDGFRVNVLASQRAVVPGAEEFAPSVTGVWLPPERTFSPLARDRRFTAEQTRHVQLSIERDLAPGVTLSLRGFDQRTTDQLVEIFDAVPGRADAPLGHYYVATAGDIDARGWSVGLTQDLRGYLRGRIEYMVAAAYWSELQDGTVMRAVRALPLSTEKVHDLQTSVEATIPQTGTRLSATYRVNTAFSSDEMDVALRGANARFNIRLNQGIPFLRSSNAEWEALVDIRNTFRESVAEASIYDEALAIRAPKRIVGGLLVRF